MSIKIPPMYAEQSSWGGSVFLSGSIPDTARWSGKFYPLEITDAVVAFARACLTHKLKIVTAAHPTLAPLLLYVAAEFPKAESPQITIYQSLLFEDVLPTATRRFEASGVGELIWTQPAAGDKPEPGRWDASLLEMRSRMLREENPLAAVFIGGMDGVRAELDQYSNLYPNRPICVARRPGGEAAQLAVENSQLVFDEVSQEASYPTLWNRFLKKAVLGSGAE